MKKVIISILILFTLVIKGIGQEKVQLTVKDAVNFALENNKTIKNAKDDLLKSEEQIKEARGMGLPKLDASLDYITNFNYEFEFGMGGGDQQLPSTLPISLEPGEQAVFEYVNAIFGNMGKGSTIKMEDQASANLKVSQLFFSGQYWVGLQMAKIGKSIQELSIKNTELDVKEQVISIYYLVLSTKALLKVLDANINNLSDVYKHTENMVKAGVAEQTDADQIKINLSQLKNSKTEMERGMEVSKNMMKLVLGIDSNKDIELTEDLFKMTDALVLKNYAFNIENNLGYQMMNLQEEIGDKQLNLQKWNYAPTLVGYYNYKEKLMTTGFDLSPKHVAGLTLTIPIFEGGVKRAKLNQQKIELEKIKRNKTLLSEQLSITYNQCLFDMKTAYANYKMQKEHVEISKRVFQNFENKYKQGMVSSLELTQANGNYLQVESNYITSIVKLLQSKLALDKLDNNI